MESSQDQRPLHRADDNGSGSALAHTDNVTGVCPATIATPFAQDFFFYGSLMDPDVLGTVLNLRHVPVYQDAWIEGYETKMWSIYPTVIPKEGGKVRGKVWRSNNSLHAARLARYETARYREERCEIKVEGGGAVIKDGSVFVWARDPQHRDLEPGSFDLDIYQAHYKPDVFRGYFS